MALSITTFSVFPKNSSGEIVAVTFEKRDGYLEQYIGGQLRATVGPEGIDRFLEEWPEALPLFDAPTEEAVSVEAPVETETVVQKLVKKFHF